jgi:hypothetical protein
VLAQKTDSSCTEFCGGLYAHPRRPRGAGKDGEENMMNVEIRFLMQGKEVSVDSSVESVVREVRATDIRVSQVKQAERAVMRNEMNSL